MAAIWKSAFVIVAVQICVAGCSAQQIARFEAKVGTARCVKDRGLAEGTPAHDACVAAYAAAANRERADGRAILLGVAGAAVQVQAAQDQGRANALVPTSPRAANQSQPKNVNNLVSQTFDTDWNYICRYADGTEINSGKTLCPRSVASAF